MDDDQAPAAVKKLADLFTKISEGIEKKQQDEFDAEIMKLYLHRESKVSISSDYDEKENSVGFSIFVSAPSSAVKPSEIHFNQFIYECLLLSDADQLKSIQECIELMERKDGSRYDLDFIPAYYNDELCEYYIHGRIRKKGYSPHPS